MRVGEANKGHCLLQSVSPSSTEIQTLRSQSKSSHTTRCGPLKVSHIRNFWEVPLKEEMDALNYSFPPSHMLECEDSNWIFNIYLGLEVRLPKIAVQQII